jgi:hypothetical protein
MFKRHQFRLASATAVGRASAIFAAFATLLALSLPARAMEMTFSSPVYKGLRIDWCVASGIGCGREAALAYCNARRFEDVASFRTEKAARSERTRLMGSGETCMAGQNCTAFASITCTRKIPYHRVFANPAIDGLRIDVCLADGTGCGKPAADAFCRAKGHGEALYGRVDPEPGRSATRAVDSGATCTGGDCRGFQQIICRAADQIEIHPAAFSQARSFSASNVDVFR